jgi:hypothetical protein
MVVQSKDLKNFLDAKKRPTRLLGDIDRFLIMQPPGDRSTTVLHPSEITKRDWCKRSSWFLLQGAKKKVDKPSFRLQSIFDTGHAVHAKWQKYFQDMGVMHGRFVCLACDHVNFGTSPSMCESCEAPARKLVYDEVTLFDDELRIKGHTDGWVKGIGDDTLIEIKTIGPGTLRMEAPSLMQQADGDFLKAFSNVNRPFGSHILQGQMYLELMKRMGHDVNEITFIYELKADQSMKEFTIKADYEMVRHVFDGARRVVDAINAGEVLECSNNPEGTCPQCDSYKEGDI